MTYQHEYDRDRLAETRNYGSNQEYVAGSGKWILLAFLAIVLAIGIATLIPPSTNVDEAQVGSIIPAPTVESE
ncbi:MAG: hypothetical protein AAF478_01205 [Pseudomonadota bacterium]